MQVRSVWKTWCGACVVLACVLVASATRVAAQDFGRVSGRVLDAETGQALEGARVSVVGTSLAAVTDAMGRFILLRVPAGSRTVVVTYLGREPQSRDVNVTGGEALTLEFSAPVAAIALEGITAVGARAMTQAEALNRQKHAANIMNVVASDQIGRFPDASAPEAVQRLPGVAVARDQGEGRYIQIRGGSPANTQVSFNGVQIPSPEGEARQIALDAVPVDMLESIEVSKAILPNMDADAIGGAVNLVTRRAPAGRVLSFEGTGGFATIRDEASGSGALTLGNRTSDGRLGYLFSGSYTRRSFGSDNVESSFDLGDEGPGDDALEEFEMRNYALWRARFGGTATVDYQVSDNTSLLLTGVYSELQDVEQRRALLHAIEDEELEFLHKNRREELATTSVSLFTQHVRPGGVKLDAGVAFTRSLEHTPYDTEISFVQEDVTFAPDISDRSRVRTNPMAGAITGSYLFDGVEPATSDTKDTDIVGSLDLTVPYSFGGGATGLLRIGGKIRDKTKTQRVTEEELELIDDAPDIELGVDVGGSFKGDLRLPIAYQFPGYSTSPDDVRGFGSRFSSQLDGSHLDEADTNDYDLDERVIAGYVMTELNLTPSFLLVPGVRFEHTSFSSDGFEWDSETEVLTPRSGERDYSRFFPMVHARYSVNPRTNLRAAVTTAIARPNFFDLVPYRLRDDEDLEIGNPDLEAMTSTNFDLLVEHYDDRIGVISAGAFYKRVIDPIFFFTADNELGGETTQPRNGDNGWIRGLEIAVQQQLRFLPGVLSGFGVYGNYTYTDSEATLPDGRAATLQGQATHVFNTALSYERARFWGQVSANYHGSYVEEYSDEAQEDRWADRHLQLDLSASYRIMPRATVFLELVNLTNEPYIAYQNTRTQPVQMEYYESWGRLGFRFNW